jgi:hypothetical protein
MAGSSNFTLYTSDGPPAGLPVQTKPNLGDLEYLGNGVEGLVQTNPIWRDARYGLLPRACAGRLYQQTQCRRAATGRAVQTNPICPRRMGRRGRGWSLCAKQTQLPEASHRGGVGRGGLREPHYSSILSFHHPRPMPIVRNKAKLGRAGLSGGRDAGRAQGNCAKQTQFLPLCRSGDRRSREGRLCETKPIPAGSLGPVHRAKQSQFRPYRRQQGPGDEGGCTNKANVSAVPGGTGPWGWGNKANLARVSGNGRGRQAWSLGRDRLCQTKPISGQADPKI